MPRNPELEAFERACRQLAKHRLVAPRLEDDELDLRGISLEDVDVLTRDDAGYYLLISAADLNRTKLRVASRSPEAQLVHAPLRRAFAIQRHLPHRVSFSAAVQQAVTLRRRDLARKSRGAVEGLLRDRLIAEGIPILMSPPVRRVPGLLIGWRKPDGVYPDPATGHPPQIYLEVKTVNRVSDDIQKRLYEVAEASLEMKALYGALRLEGFALETLEGVESSPALRARMRKQILGVHPIVVAFFICPRAEAERYRAGAEAFIDRLFFQEEVDACLVFLRETIEGLTRGE